MSEARAGLIPILRMSPRMTPRPWGGNRLGSIFGKHIPPGEKIGESWELSDHPEGPSSIEGGPYDGELFGDLVRRFPEEMVGRSAAPERFPLLVKYIDAQEDLSIQVHPSDSDAARLGMSDRGKTECWWILDCPPNGEIVYGLREGATRTDLERAIQEGSIPDVVRRVPIHPGDFLFVPPGTVHAILAGTMLCEIQQSSNITFRLWDWDRSPARTLHLGQSLDVIRFGDPDLPQPIWATADRIDEPRVRVLTDNPFFTVKAVELPAGAGYAMETGGRGVIANGVEGACRLNENSVRPGKTLFVPACQPRIEVVAGNAPVVLLLTESNE